MNYTNKTYICHHCGNEGIMIEHSNYTHELHLDSYDSYEEIKFFECPVCHKPIIYELLLSDDDFDTDENGNRIATEFIVYPNNKLNYHVPKEIRQAYESALLTKNTDLNIFALSLRRTLELIVKNKNANGKDLAAKIKNLSSIGIFPQTLNSAATITRLIGNIGAHSIIKDNLSLYDLEKLSEIVKYIIEYVYILPEEIKRLQKLESENNQKN